MATYAEKRNAIAAIVPSDLLDQFVEWIRDNMSPEDVFTDDQLNSWADDNYTSYEDVPL